MEGAGSRGSEKGSVRGVRVDGGERVGSVAKVSFRDKVLGGTEGCFARLERDLVKKKLVTISYEDGDYLQPKVVFAESVLEKMAAPWKDALVVKLLGKSISFTAMKEKLRGIWRLKSGYDVMAVGNDYFMVKFDSAEDRNKVIED